VAGPRSPWTGPEVTRDLHSPAGGRPRLPSTLHCAAAAGVSPPLTPRMRDSGAPVRYVSAAPGGRCRRQVECWRHY
jgi:hypothetical protein